MIDQRTDMLPPWEQFPTFERFSIGWRMGPGEDYLHTWNAFIDDLPKEYHARLNYLKRHRPAPLNWCRTVLTVLIGETDSEQQFDCSRAESLRLLDLGLIERDAAYQTWLTRQTGIVWPWTWPVSGTPELAARYRTRELWFFSRQLSTMRRSGPIELEGIPDGWRRCETELVTGRLGDLDLDQGLLALAQMLCAGSIKPPWNFTLTLEDFSGSYAVDMKYTDAFRLWIMSAFDDDLLLQKMLNSTQAPRKWVKWVYQQAGLSR